MVNILKTSIKIALNSTISLNLQLASKIFLCLKKEKKEKKIDLQLNKVSIQ